MLALTQFTDSDHGGGVLEDVTADQVGSPDRLRCCQMCVVEMLYRELVAYLMDVTCQPRAVAALQMRLPVHHGQ